MDEGKKRRLEAAGWKVGTVTEYLGLSPAEEVVVEMRVALTRRLRQLREERGITQQALADMLGTSQPRISAMESGQGSASLDALIGAIAALGDGKREIAAAIASDG